MNLNWNMFVQKLEGEGVPNFTSDGKEIWNLMNETLVRIFQHKYTTLTHTDKIELKRELFRVCFKVLFTSD